MSRVLRLAVLAGCVASGAPLSAQEYPATAPGPTPLTPANLPPLQEAMLANGLRLILIESHEQPLLSLVLTLPAGTVYDPAGKEGVAEMVAGLLTRGAGDRSADELNAAIENVGGSLSASTGPDFLTIQADVLSTEAALAFELVGDVTLRPAFALGELEVLRRQATADLQNELSEPAAVGARVLALGLYGTHPYGRRATPQGISAIARTDLLSFHAAHVRPGGSLLVIAGDLTLPRAKQLAESTFGKWAGTAPAPLFPKPPVHTRTETILVHRPGAPRSIILIGNLTFTSTDTTYLATLVASHLLAGGKDSRLARSLGHQHRWADNPESSITRPRGEGAFEVSADVPTEATDSALHEILLQRRRIGTEPVPAPELEAARNALAGSFPLGIQTVSQLAAAVAEARALGLPATDLRMYRSRLSAVSALQVVKAARRSLRADSNLIVVVGDGSRIYAALTHLGPVRLVSTEGNPLTPADLVVRKGPVDLDLSQLQPRTDSLIVLLQGRAAGTEVTKLEKTAMGYRYIDESRITGFVQQTTEIDLDARAAMRRVTQTGKMQGQDTRIELAYDDRRVTGSARVMSPQGPKAFAVDTLIPPGTLDDNAVQALLPAFRWSASARWELWVFSSGENRVEQMTLVVTGVGKVSVPAGEFECYQAELSGGTQRVAFYVTTAKPHRLVRIAIAGAPIEFVAAK